MKEKIDPAKALADAIQDALSAHLERGAGLAAVKAINATDNQKVKLSLAVRIERNERGRYVITPAAAVEVKDTDSLETAATVFDPCQMTLGMEKDGEG